MFTNCDQNPRDSGVGFISVTNHSPKNYPQMGGHHNQSILQRGGFLGISMDFIARLLIASFFIFMGITSIINFSQTSQTLGSIGYTILTIIVQIIGGLLFTGIFALTDGISVGKWLLIFFMAAYTIFNYNQSQFNDMFKNIAIMGGLLLA